MMASPPRIHACPDLASAAKLLAGLVAAQLAAVLARQERAIIALPGGATPLPFLQALGQRDLPWHRITAMPGDERFVPLADPQSNERQIRLHFPPVADHRCLLVSLRGEAETPELAAAQVSANPLLAQPVDLVICGMGADGHIASLFPGMAVLDNPDAPHPPVLATHPPGLVPRLTLSPTALRQAGWRGLLFAGAEKHAVFQQALSPGPPAALPVRLLLDGPCEICFGIET